MIISFEPKLTVILFTLRGHVRKSRMVPVTLQVVLYSSRANTSYCLDGIKFL